MAKLRHRPRDPGVNSRPGDTEDGVVVRARGLGKVFKLYQSEKDRLLEIIGPPRHQILWALKDVSFSIRKGEAVGIIGSNGAGKSTLLKLLAGISRPSEGELHVKASISSLLDLGLGFHGSFSGRENIYLNCTLQGMSRESVDELLPAIVDFAEIEDFIDFPVKTYSAGMKLRLGFAISAFMDYDIFLIDEVLAVGDQYFQRKCIRKIEDFIDQGKTIILVSHDLHAIRSICDRAIWLQKGQIRDQGLAVDVVDAYVDSVRARESGNGDRTRKSRENFRRKRRATPAERLPQMDLDYQATTDDISLRDAIGYAMALPDVDALWARQDASDPYHDYHGEQPMVTGTGEVRLIELKILDATGEECRTFETGDSLTVALTFKTTEPVDDPIFGVAIHRNDDAYVFGPNTHFDDRLRGTYHGVYTLFYNLPALRLLTGTYLLSVALWHKSHLKPYIWHNRLYEISIKAEQPDHGMVLMDHHWGMIKHISGGAEDLKPEGFGGGGDGTS